MACPFVHLCSNTSCMEQSMCQDKTFWSHYWIVKMRKEAANSTITKYQKKNLKKIKRREIGRKALARQQKEIVRKELFSSTPHCVKEKNCCDKMAACIILGQCIVTIDRIKNNANLLELLRGPRSIKQIIQLLAKYDPMPMKTWYF